MQPGKLYVFCGKMASGKSTLASKIAKQKTAVLISEDHLLGSLYPGEVIDVPSYVRCSGKVKLAMGQVVIDILVSGGSVVLDFPANTVKQRRWIKELLLQAGASHELHLLNYSDAVCKEQLRERAKKKPDRRMTDTEAMFDVMSGYFELPSSDEGFDIVEYRR